MTAQIAENLLYEGDTVSMCTEPLAEYFFLSGNYPSFAANCTALWRGYVGSWEIKDHRLYLVGLEGTLEDGTDVSLATLFPDFPERVFAHWYSGTIRIPRGKQLKYVHSGYSSTFEQDLLLEIDQGVVVSTRTRHNGISDSENAPSSYGVGAMTVFPLRGKQVEETK
jgi:hypothetical protein